MIHLHAWVVYHYGRNEIQCERCKDKRILMFRIQKNILPPDGKAFITKHSRCVGLDLWGKYGN